MNNKLSAAMCVYGGDDAACFDAAFNSIIRQTVPPDEILLTVDGPIPHSIEEVIGRYESMLSDSPIHLKTVRLKENKGHGEARRIGLKNCTNTWVALMDSDDISIPERFEKQLAFVADNPDVSVVGGFNTEFVTNGADPTDTSREMGRRTVPAFDEDIKAYMKKRCPMNQGTVLLNKSDVEEVGGYLDWYCDEDCYLWIRLALAGKTFGNIQETLVYFRVGEEMYQRRGGLKYFQSEAKLQQYMLSKRMIGFWRYAMNVGVRFIVQVVVPNGIRGWMYQRFARD